MVENKFFMYTAHYNIIYVPERKNTAEVTPPPERTIKNASSRVNAYNMVAVLRRILLFIIIIILLSDHSAFHSR